MLVKEDRRMKKIKNKKFKLKTEYKGKWSTLKRKNERKRKSRKDEIDRKNEKK
jgi:hypothetical protein